MKLLEAEQLQSSALTHLGEKITLAIIGGIWHINFRDIQTDNFSRAVLLMQMIRMTELAPVFGVGEAV